MNSCSYRYCWLTTILLATVAQLEGQTFYVPGGSVGNSGNSNIGIATSSPTVRLDFGTSVANEKRIIGTFNTGNVFAGVGMDATTAGIRLAGDPSANSNPLLDVGYYSMDGNFTWTSRAWFAGNGYVGIGTTTPGARLDVAGTAIVDYLAVDAGDAINEGGEIALVGAGSFGTFQIDNFQGHARIHTLAAGKLFQVLGGSLYADGTANNFFASNVGIGTSSPSHKLSVNGTIKTKEIIVETTGWADDVFAEGYRLKALGEVEAFIAENKHLPDVPSAAIVAEQGIAVGEMQATLLRKIEELTLYVIQQEQRLNAQQAEIGQLKSQLGQSSGFTKP